MVLTKRQKEIYSYLVSFIRKEGYAPSIHEIQREFSINSPATVHQHLKNLQDKKLIYREPNRHRSIDIVESSLPQERGGGVRVPLLGNIAAGYPIESYAESEELLLPGDMVADGSGVYLLKVMGDSMVGDHILDGDLVIVRKSETARAGQPVVALIDGREATLKRYYPENENVRLQPANPSMEPMVYPAEKVQIQGVVVGIMRKFS